MKNTALNDLIRQQYQSVQQLQDYLTEHNIDEGLAENAQLQDKLNQLLQENQKLSAKINQQNQKITQQRAGIIDLLLELKTKYVGQTSQQLRKILGQTEAAGYQKFIQSQKAFERALQELESIIQDLDRQYNQDLITQVAILKQQAHKRVAQDRQVLQAKTQEIDQHLITEVAQAFIAAPISEAGVDQTMTEHRFETKIGLKGFNYIGIGFIFLAMLVLGRLGIQHISDGLKSGLLFATAFLFFIGGAYFRRQDKSIFAQGLIGGAFGMSYIATFTSYFVFHLFASPVALAILLGISGLSFIFATLYRSRAIGNLAILGGYVPLIAYLALTQGPSDVAMTVARLYVLLITTVAVLLSQRFNWQELTLLAYVLLTPWLSILGLVYPSHVLLTLAYCSYFLVLFVGLPLYLQRKKVRELSALGTVSVIGMLLTYSLVSLLHGQTQITSYQTLLVLGLNLALYWGLARYLTAVAANPMNPRPGLVRFSFVAGVVESFIIALVWVPWHFASNWSQTLSFMLVGSSLLTYAYLLVGQRLRLRECRIVSLVAVMSYYVIFLKQVTISEQSVLSFLSFGMIIATFVLAKRANLWQEFQTLALAVLYLQGNVMLMSLIGTLMRASAIDHRFVLTLVLQVLATSLVAMVSRYFKTFKETGIPLGHASLIISVMPFLNVVVGLFHLNIWALMSVHLLNVVVCYLAYDLVRHLYVKQKLSLVLAVISFSSYFMLNALLLAYTNYHFAYLTISVDVSLGLIALGYIIYGFKRQLQPLRVTGLILILLAMAKLLILDLSYSSLVSRMLVLLIFGGLSLLISYLYQTLDKQYRETVAVLAQSDLDNSNEQSLDKRQK